MGVVPKEVLLLLQGLGQAQLVLDVLLPPALDDHVALLQVEDEVSHHVHYLVFGAFVHQIGLRQDSCDPETLVRECSQLRRAKSKDSSCPWEGRSPGPWLPPTLFEGTQ